MIKKFKKFLKRLLFMFVSPIYLPLAWFKAFRLTRKKRKLGDEYDDLRAYKFIKRIAKFVVTILNIQVNVINLEKWTYTPGLIVSNHQSNIDGIIIMLALMQNEKHSSDLAFIAKDELEKDKLYGPFLKCINTYFINRENAREVLETFEKAKNEMTTKRNSLVIFPEGTRSKGSEMNKFHPGAFKLATQTYVPIKPLSLIDTYKYKKKNKEGKREVKVICDDELPADRVLSMNTIGLSNFIWERINKDVKQHSSEVIDSNSEKNNSKIKDDMESKKNP